MSSFTMRWSTLALAFGLAGCSTTGHRAQDPLEGFNRVMFQFNDTVDRVAFKPAAQIYDSVLPSFMQTGIGNFFGNLNDVSASINNLLQGKVADGLSDFMRVAVNSTLGLAGVLDIASEAGMQKHKEDFGQTLGKWGVASGPYIVLPIFGASTLRDAAMLPLDLKADPWLYTDPVRVRNVGSVVRIVDQRAAVLDASNLIEEAALDRYEFIRDAYLQRRESKIYDGDIPHRKIEPGPRGDDQSDYNAPSAPEPIHPAEPGSGMDVKPAQK